MDKPIQVFISYAHEDEPHRARLEKSLKLMERQGLVTAWHDRRIVPGREWKKEIDDALEKAGLILLLVSDDFFASDYCWGLEMKRALEKHDAREAQVVPIIVRACAWKDSPVARLQVLPTGGKAISSWSVEDEAWLKVSDGLRRAVEDVPAPEGKPASGLVADPRRYLQAIEAANSSVEIRGMGAKVAERLPLDRIYTRLHVRHGRQERRGEESARSEKTRPGVDGAAPALRERNLELRDVLADHPSAVLIGDPGSGKTTFLRFVAQVLARSLLGGSKDLTVKHLGIEGEVPFPILVRLSELAEFLTKHEDESYSEEAPEHLRRFLDYTLAGQAYGLPAGYLRGRLDAGGCFVLLDGLDEVPEAFRERVSSIAEKVVVAGRWVGNRHLITCRTRAYEGLVRLDLASFRLASFERAQVEAFVDSWAQALFRVERGDRESAEAVEAERYRLSLKEAISSHPNVGPLSENPLMLTMLAVVHWNQKRLPEQRANLYDVAVEYLLESRRKQAGLPGQLRREALQALALRMFQDDEGVQRSLGRLEAADAVADVLGVDRREAIEFLEAESLHSGLLVSRTEGEVEFWHLTFQEYLAALELAMSGEAWEGIRERLYEDQWSEVVLLLGGCLRRTGGVRSARRYIEKILATGEDRVSRARSVGLIGRILRDVRPYGGDPAAGTEYEAVLRQTLEIFEPDGEEVSESVRVEVGEALGQAGDPRLDDADGNRILIAAGSFLMGAQKTDKGAKGFDPDADDDEAPVHPVSISEFRMARYPVTVQEFRAFVEAGQNGYLHPRWWEPKGWAWREEEGAEAPAEWKVQLRHPTRPVTMVSWFEADAYCRWAGGRLPTEAEREYAARGSGGRRFPWGDAEPTDRHANFAGRVGGSTPVGIYPQGATPEGLCDLAGNTWEWCRDWFGPPYPEDLQTDPVGPDSGSGRVLRGGAFGSVPGYLRGAYRGSYHPELRYSYRFGFRVVWVSSGGLD